MQALRRFVMHVLPYCTSIMYANAFPITGTMTTPLLSTRLASRVTIITGSSSGVGRAIALAFAANGASPIICSDLRPDVRDRWGIADADVPTHELICQRYGEGKAVYVQTDVTIAADVEKVVQKAVEVGGRLDV